MAEPRRRKGVIKAVRNPEAYPHSDERVPASVRKRLIEQNEGDHISTKRQQ